MMGNEVEKVLDALAERFGTTVEMLWSVLLRQMFIEAIGAFVYLVFILLLVVIVMWVWAKLLKNYRHFMESDDNGPEKFYSIDNFPEYLMLNIHPLICIVLMLASIFSIIAVLFVPSLLLSGIGKLLNPEYYALQKVLEML